MDDHYDIIFTRSIMGNNGWLLLHIIMLFLHCHCIIITHYYIVIMSWFLHIITHYCILLHIIAYCCVCHLVLTGPRAEASTVSTPEIMETPDDDVPEHDPKTWSPPLAGSETTLSHSSWCARKPEAEVHSSLEIAGPGSCSGQAISANNTDNSRKNWNKRDHHDYYASSSAWLGQGPGSWGWIWRVHWQNKAQQAQGWLYHDIQVSVWGLFVSSCN